MKRTVVASLGFAILGVAILSSSCSNLPVKFNKVEITDQRETVDASILWPRLDADFAKAGAGMGVAINSQGHILYLHTAGREFGNNEIIGDSTIVEIDPKTETVLNSFGANLFQYPHSLTIDEQDNLWITDLMLNKVFKLDKSGKLLAEFGKSYPWYLETAYRINNVLPWFPVTSDPAYFARPTDVAVNAAGEFVVSDGYRNHRLVKFDKNGTMIWQVNNYGTGNSEFNLPHGIALDEEGRIYMVDRDNARIQVFSNDGKWLATWDQSNLGRPFGVRVKNNTVYVIDGGDLLNGKKEELHSQVLMLNKQGDIVKRWGVWGTEVGNLQIPHAIAIDNDGTVYVAELHNKRLQRFQVW